MKLLDGHNEGYGGSRIHHWGPELNSVQKQHKGMNVYIRGRTETLNSLLIKVTAPLRASGWGRPAWCARWVEIDRVTIPSIRLISSE